MTLDEMLDPRQAALIVVDMQNDFCASDGSLARAGGDVSMIQQMAPRLERLLAAARQITMPIVHVRTEHSPWTDSASWVGRHAGERRTVCFPESWGADFFAGFAPRSDAGREAGQHEFVVTKHRYSGFLGTELDLVLKANGVRTVLVTGEATNVCVESTARDAFMHDFFVVTVADCTAAAVREAHDAALYTLGKHFGRVASSDTILAAWGLASAASSVAPRTVTAAR